MTGLQESQPGNPPHRRRTIGVVVPVYNRERLLPRALRSIFAQTCPPDEIVVVDDGSDDHSAQVAAALDTSITVIRQTNRGVASARNEGVRALRTAWVAFIDSDDAWRPTFLERMHGAMDATSDRADLYFADAYWDDEGITQWERAGLEIAPPYELSVDASHWLLGSVHPMLIGTTVVRAIAYVQRGGCDERLRTREDTSFFFRVGLGHAACAVPTVGMDVHGDAGAHRLTKDLDQRSEAYWTATALLYQEVMSHRSATSGARSAGSSRAAHAHRKLADIALRLGRPRDAVLHTAHAARLDAPGLGRGLGRRLTRLASGRIRHPDPH